MGAAGAGSSCSNASELGAWVLLVPAPRARRFCACLLQKTGHVPAPRARRFCSCSLMSSLLFLFLLVSPSLASSWCSIERKKEKEGRRLAPPALCSRASIFDSSGPLWRSQTFTSSCINLKLHHQPKLMPTRRPKMQPATNAGSSYSHCTLLDPHPNLIRDLVQSFRLLVLLSQRQQHQRKQLFP